jgi:hypothetical protein
MNNSIIFDSNTYNNFLKTNYRINYIHSSKLNNWNSPNMISNIGTIVNLHSKKKNSSKVINKIDVILGNINLVIKNLFDNLKLIGFKNCKLSFCRTDKSNLDKNIFIFHSSNKEKLPKFLHIQIKLIESFIKNKKLIPMLDINSFSLCLISTSVHNEYCTLSKFLGLNVYPLFKLYGDQSKCMSNYVTTPCMDVHKKWVKMKTYKQYDPTKDTYLLWNGCTGNPGDANPSYWGAFTCDAAGGNDNGTWHSAQNADCYTAMVAYCDKVEKPTSDAISYCGDIENCNNNNYSNPSYCGTW